MDIGKNNIRVLLVEGSAQEAEKTCRFLSAENPSLFVIKRVPSVAAGLNYLAGETTDAVILDPSAAGEARLDEIGVLHRHAPPAPIIILRSFFSEDTLPPETIRQGVHEYFMTDQDGGRMLSRTIRYEIERKRLEEQLHREAIQDSLTGLFNRRYFSQRLHEEICRSNRTSRPFALLLGDVDFFKSVNDDLGHQAGDVVLKSVAECLRESVRGTDLVFRWGGDEFVVILSNTAQEGALVVAERVRQGVCEMRAASSMQLDFSIGVALYPQHGMTEDELIHAVDQAMYQAKKGTRKIHCGKGYCHLGEHLISTVFQPIVSVPQGMKISDVPILGYEALSRDAQGVLSAIDLFKKYKGMGRLGELKTICFQAQFRQAQQARLGRVFINIDFDLIKEMPPPDKPGDLDVVLEISERAVLLDVEERMQYIRRWRDKGYQFAIDDFGSGAMSLNFLADLHPDYIKLDRTALLRIQASGEFRAILKDLLAAIGKCASRGIIAEGVETQADLRSVKEMDIPMAQGYLFGMPQVLG